MVFQYPESFQFWVLMGVLVFFLSLPVYEWGVNKLKKQKKDFSNIEVAFL